ncbi:MAG: TlpA family protein disulfide reductase [Acidimicrobiia bacterium]|nr:TlpA family protein disulfide reductase [Acidimicrobiia bacterium]
MTDQQLETVAQSSNGSRPQSGLEPLGAGPDRGSSRLLMALVAVLLIGLVVAAVLVGGVGTSDDDASTSAPASTTAPTSPAVAPHEPEIEYPDQTPGPAPDFDFTTFDGRQVSLAALRGSPVVLNFWASWCVPCRKEMPAFQQLSDELAGRVSFVGLASQDGEADARRFAEANSIDYTLGLAPDGLADSMGVFGLPSTFLIDTNGSIVDAHFGELSHDELLAKLQRYGFA